MFIQLLQNDPVTYLTWVTLVTFSICLHEYAHAWVALTQGDDTAARRGYLTMNPLKTMGPFALVFLAVAGIAWGQVPVDPGRMRSRSGRALTAGAGPAANLALAGAFFLAFWLILAVGVGQPLPFVAQTGLRANLFLLLFNLLPLPMLDGWEIYECIVPPLRRIPPALTRQIGLAGLLVLLATGWFRHIWRAAALVTDVVTGMVP